MRLNRNFAYHRVKRIYFLICPVVFTLILFPTRVDASEQIGTITSIEVIQDGRINIQLNGGARSDRPGCADYEYWFIADEESPAGREQLNTLLSALVSGRSVRVVGTGDCNRWLDGEDIASVTLQ